MKHLVVTRPLLILVLLAAAITVAAAAPAASPATPELYIFTFGQENGDTPYSVSKINTLGEPRELSWYILYTGLYTAPFNRQFDNSRCVLAPHRTVMLHDDSDHIHTIVPGTTSIYIGVVNALTLEPTHLNTAAVIQLAYYPPAATPAPNP